MYFEMFKANFHDVATSPDVSLLATLYAAASGKTSGKFASMKDISLTSLGNMAQHIMLLRRTDQSDFEYLHYGSKIAEASGFDMTGKKVSDFKGEIGLFFKSAYEQVLRDGGVLFTIHRATYAIEVHLWERLLCPVILDDGTEGVLVLNKVRESRDNLLTAVLSTMSDGVMVVQFVRDTNGYVKDGTVKLVNRAFCAMVEKPSEHFLDQLLLDVFPDLISRGHWPRYLIVAATRKPVVFEADLRDARPNAQYEVCLSPMNDGVLVTVRDKDATAKRMIA